MASVTLAQASAIIDRALKTARDTKSAPITVVVLDAGAHLVAAKREDKATMLRFDIAYGKAWGALGMGVGSRELSERAAKNPGFYASLSAVTDGRMITVPGGVLIKNAEGDVIGAVGVSGDTADRDEECALAGVTAANLVGQAGAK